MSKRRRYSLHALNPKTNYRHPSAKQKFHEIPKNNRPTKRTMAGHKGTYLAVQFPNYMGRTEETIQQEKPIQKSPQTWQELKGFWIQRLHAEIGFRTNKIVSCHIAMVTLRADVEKFKGSNITNCFEKWANIAQDQFVLYILKFLLIIEVPVCQFVSSWNFSPAETEMIDAEISKLLSKGVIINTPDHVSWTSSRTKKSGDYRMILNLKSLNRF